MGKKYVTTDTDGTILEPFDEDNKNVPDDARPITNDDFLLLMGNFSQCKLVDGALVKNLDFEAAQMKAELIERERKKAIENLIAAKRTQIEKMTHAELKTTINKK